MAALAVKLPDTVGDRNDRYGGAAAFGCVETVGYCLLVDQRTGSVVDGYKSFRFLYCMKGILYRFETVFTADGNAMGYGELMLPADVVP